MPGAAASSRGSAPGHGGSPPRSIALRPPCLSCIKPPLRRGEFAQPHADADRLAVTIERQCHRVARLLVRQCREQVVLAGDAKTPGSSSRSTPS